MESLEKNESGYADVRKEHIQQESFRVKNGEIQDVVNAEQSGEMIRIAGDNAFLLNPDEPRLSFRETDFSRFIKKHFERMGEPSIREEADAEKFLPISEDLVEVAKSFAHGNIDSRFLWRHRRVSWGNSMKMKRERTEQTRMVRLELTEKLPQGNLHLRRFLHNPTPNSLTQAFKEMKEEEEKLKDASLCAPGEMDVLLDPSVSAVFAHEVFGHPAEWRRNVLSFGEGLGRRVASGHLSVEDDPQASQGALNMPFDDEGVTASPLRIIEKGVLMNGLNCLESAFQRQKKPNGRARARDFKHIPLSRMTNIRILPGEDSFESLLARIDRGLILVGSLGAIISTPSYGICCQFGQEIRKGKLGKYVLAPVLSGDLSGALANIRGVGNESKWVEDGGCLADAQFLNLSGRGAPHLLLSKAFIS